MRHQRWLLLLLALLLCVLPTSASAYRLAVGSYTVGGSASDNRDIVTSPAFQPDMVTVKCDAAVRQVWSIPDMGADQSFYFSIASPITNAIQAFNADGFQVGTAGEVQSLNVTCYYAAIGADGRSDFARGSYTGNGGNDRDIVISPAFLPQVVWLVRAATDAAIWRSSGHSGDSASRFGFSANAADLVQALNSDGFEVGTDTEVNGNTFTYYYVAIGAVSQYNAAGSFTGNTDDDRDISTIANPVFALIKGNSATEAVHMRFGAAGDLSWSVSNVALFTNRIQAFQATGFQVGTYSGVNENTVLMTWWVSSAPIYARRGARPVFFP